MEHLEDAHMELLRSENAQPVGEASWFKWLRDAEALFGHDLDGDETEAGTDGYSLDSAYDAWGAGVTVAAYHAGDRSASPHLA